VLTCRDTKPVRQIAGNDDESVTPVAASVFISREWSQSFPYMIEISLAGYTCAVRRFKKTFRDLHGQWLAAMFRFASTILVTQSPRKLTMISIEQQKSILTLCLMAAFADGQKDEREREALKGIAESLAGEGGSAAALNLPQIYQDVLFKRVTLESASSALATAEAKHLAYEMAVHIIDADGKQSDAERAFLATLRTQLGMSEAEATTIARDADAIAEAAHIPAAAALTATGTAATPMQPDEVALDKSILNYSILNGALELLPQSWATMAIIPLQTRMVYNIGKSYGYELDSGHIKEFLATVGVGLASQYLEQAGRKLIGGLFGKLAGGLVGSLARGATGMAFSFASTYALGQLAKRYYGGGRTMSTQVLKQTFDQLLSPAKELQAKYAPQIQEKARNLNVSDVMAMVRGQKI
jgi:uncharacterized protein (DUF697 family)/uncharacterized tellurite resistance protein B-like protein